MPFIICTKRNFKSLLFIVLLLVMPAIAVGYNIIGNSVYKNPVIGMYFDCKSSYVFDGISSETMDFKTYDSIEDMKKDITIGKIDSGFVFDAKFDNAVESLDFKNSVDYIVSKGSVLNTIAGEFIYKSMLENFSSDIANKFFKDRNIDIQADLFYNDFINSDEVFNISFEEVNNNAEIKYEFKLSNIFAVFVFIGGIICSINIVSDRKKGIRKFNFLYIFTSVFWLMLSALIASVLCNEFSPSLTAVYILYALSVAAFSFIISFVNNKEIICGILPVLAILSFILSSAIFDIGSINDIYGYANYILPPYYFTQHNSLALLIYTAALGVLSLMLDRRKFI